MTPSEKELKALFAQHELPSPDEILPHDVIAFWAGWNSGAADALKDSLARILQDLQRTIAAIPVENIKVIADPDERLLGLYDVTLIFQHTAHTVFAQRPSVAPTVRQPLNSTGRTFDAADISDSRLDGLRLLQYLEKVVPLPSYSELVVMYQQYLWGKRLPAPIGLKSYLQALPARIFAAEGYLMRHNTLELSDPHCIEAIEILHELEDLPEGLDYILEFNPSSPNSAAAQQFGHEIDTAIERGTQRLTAIANTIRAGRKERLEPTMLM